MEIGPVVSQLMITFDLIFSNIDSIQSILILS